MTKIVLLGFLGVALIIGIYQAIRITRLINAGKELARTTKAYEQHPSSPTSNVLVIGDSSAVGVGAGSPEESVAGRLGVDHPAMAITNQAVNGRRVADLWQNFNPPDTEHYDLVLIQIGGNDTLKLTDYGSLREQLPVVLERASSIGNNVALISSGNFVAAPLFPWPVDRYLGYRSKQVRDVFAELSQQAGVAYVDLYRSTHETLSRENLDRDYAADGFHLSSRGYAYWYEQLVKTLQEDGIVLPK